MATVEVATAYVSLVPSARGFGDKVRNEIGSDLGRAGGNAGEQYSKSFADKAAKGLSSFGSKASKFLTIPILAGFAFAGKAASDLSESVNKTDVVFGKAAQSVHAFSASSAKDLGISKRGAEEAAGTFGNLFVALKIGQTDAANMSTKLVGLAADLASFNNVSPEEALEALRSGLVGETEPLRKFGVNLNDAALREEALSLGLVKTTKDVLPPAAKAQAAYSAIMKQTSVAQGDFERTSGGLANQQRILKAQFEDTAATVGGKLLPYGLKLVSFANDAVTAFTKLPEPLQNSLLVLGAMAAVSGPLAAGIGKAITAGKALGTVFEVLTIKATTLQLAAGGFGLLFLGLGVAAYAINGIRQSFRDMAQAADNDLAKAVNNLALFDGTQKDVAISAYKAAAGVHSMNEAVQGPGFSKRLSEEAKVASDVLVELSSKSGLTKERIVQLANSLGINLAKATEDQREQMTQAIAEIGRAVTPTERLDSVTETLGNTAATTAEKFDAFKEALDAALGVYITADQATIRYQDRIAALKQSIIDNGTVTGFATDKQRLLTGALIDTVSGASDEVQALVRSGQISADAGEQKQALIGRLVELKKKFPELAGKIDEYITHIEAIPGEKTTNVAVTGTDSAISKLNAVHQAAANISTGLGLLLGVKPQGDGRARGGDVIPGKFYEVTEGGKSELLQEGGRTYLLPGQRGTVIPAAPAGSSAHLPAASDGPTSESLAELLGGGWVIEADGYQIGRLVSRQFEDLRVAHS